jgi:hypothetical protein
LEGDKESMLRIKKEKSIFIKGMATKRKLIKESIEKVMPMIMDHENV